VCVYNIRVETNTGGGGGGGGGDRGLVADKRMSVI
jgi:hypothetical protein